MSDLKAKFWGVLLVAGFIFGTYLTFTLPTEWVLKHFRPVVDAKDLNIYAIGALPGEDIIILESTNQYDTNEISRNAYVTVIPKNVIPLDGYRLKNRQDMRRSEQLVGGRRQRNLPLYTTSTWFGERDNYNQYYMLELQDGSLILAFVEDAYAKMGMRGEAVKMPIGSLKNASKEEKAFVKKAGYELYDEKVLDMFSEKFHMDYHGLELFLRIVYWVVIMITLGITWMLMVYFLIKKEGDVQNE